MERKKQKLSSQNRKTNGRKKVEKEGERPNQKAITCGTAVGVKQGRTKGNKQKSKYENQERIHEKSGRKEWGCVEV